MLETLLKHAISVVFALGFNLLLRRMQPAFDHWNGRIRTIVSNRTQLAVGFMLLGVFSWIFVLSRPSFYTPYYGGVTGDNYNYARSAVQDPGYFTVQHLFHPTVIGLLRSWMDPTGSRARDQSNLAQAYLSFSWPARLANLAGGLFAFLILRRLGISKRRSLVGAGFLLTSYAYWFWSLQSHAVGVVSAWSLVMLWLVLKAVDEGRLFWYSAAGVAAALAVYIHISAFFVSLAVAFVVAAVCIARAAKGGWAPIGQLVAFGLPPIALALLLYRLASAQYQCSDPSILITRVSDVSLLGPFALDAHAWREFFIGTVGVSLAFILNLVSEPTKSTAEFVLLRAQYGLVLLLAVSLLDIDRRRFFSWKANRGWLVMAIVIVVVRFGFSLRTTWFQYASALSALTVVAVVGLALHPARNSAVSGARNMVILLSLGATLILANGFGTTSVYAGERLNGDPAYRTLSAVRAIGGGDPVVFAGSVPGYPYNTGAILSYYALNPENRRIEWRPLKDGESLLALREDRPNAWIIVPAGLTSASEADLIKGARVSNFSTDFPAVYICPPLRSTSSVTHPSGSRTLTR